MSVGEVVIGPQVWVVGVETSGPGDDDVTERVRLRLGHGEDPLTLLRSRGFDGSPRTVVGQAVPHVLEIVFDVGPFDSPHEAVAVVPAQDPGLVLAPGERPTAYQRVAVYAVVRSARGVLFSRNSARTNAEGTWGLAGGGLDPGELPEAALHREVWEETGQVVEVSGLVLVSTRHWVGRAPYGRLEDFHAVRLVYAAICTDPTDPVVHDVGGTTSDAAWVPEHEIESLALTPGWRDLVLALVHQDR